jgi:hypothetical protein
MCRQLHEETVVAYGRPFTVTRVEVKEQVDQCIGDNRIIDTGETVSSKWALAIESWGKTVTWRRTERVLFEWYIGLNQLERIFVWLIVETCNRIALNYLGLLMFKY